MYFRNLRTLYVVAKRDFYHEMPKMPTRCSSLNLIFLSLKIKDEHSMALLDDDGACLEDTGFLDDHSILVEVRSRDGTWPEEITSLATTTNHGMFCQSYTWF